MSRLRALTTGLLADTPIGMRLKLLVASLALPLNGLIVLVIVSLASASNDAQRQSLLYNARSVAAAVDAQLGKYIAVGESLGRSPALRADNLARFEAEAREALVGVPESWVLVADLEGRQLLNTHPSATHPLPRRNPAALEGQRKALEWRAITVGGARRSTTSGEWIATVEVPVDKDGAPFRVLAIAIRLSSFASLLGTRALPNGWIAGIIDENGRFISRVPAHHVGDLASQGWRETRDQVGIFELVSIEGDTIVQANARSALSGWRVGVAVKSSALTAATWSTIRWATLLGGILSALSLALAVGIARAISEPLAALRRNATAAIGGASPEFSPSTPEVRELWSALHRAVQDQARANDLLASIVSTSSDAILTKSLDGTITSWNAGAERVFGYAGEEMVGTSIRRLIPADRQSEEDAILARLARGERIEHFETLRLHKSGRPIDVSVAISPIRGATGTIVGASKIVRDISEQKAAVQRITESEQRLSRILNTVNAYVGLLDTSGRIIEINSRAADAAGLPREALLGCHMADAPWWSCSPEVARRMREIVARALAGETVRCDLNYGRGDGELRWLDFQAAPVLSLDGRVTAVVPSGVDITDRKQAEENVRILMFEMNHRAKNMLGLVLAIARQTVGSSPEDYLARFTERIQALAANQGLLVQNDWRGADVRDVVRSQLAPFESLIGERIEIDGPATMLQPKAAQGIGMALHELTTNASKYGALSNACGRIRILWRLDRGRFEMSWSERDGPRVSPPTRRGFGRQVLTTIAQSSVDGKVTLDYAAEGLDWCLSCPLEAACMGEPGPHAGATPGPGMTRH